MRLTVFVVVVAGALTTPSAVAQNNGPTSNLTLAQVVAKVQAVNARTRTFSATFTQQYLAHAYNTTTSSSGSVVVSAPKSDWSYATPAGQRVVTDATTACVYVPAANQLYMQSADISQYAVTALLMQSNFANYFTFALLPGQQLQYSGGYVLVGTPVQTSSAYTKVLLYVAAQTFEIDRVMFLDWQQNRNRFDFANVQRNAPSTNATFVLHPPMNATLVVPHGKPSLVPPTCP